MSNSISDAADIVVACVRMAYTHDLPWFLVSVVGGLALAAGGWWACAVFAKMWNTKYDLNWAHHLLCAICGLLVFLTVVLGFSLSYTKAVAEEKLDEWAESLKEDTEWKHETFTQAYDAIKIAGKEDFSRLKDPREGGNIIPLSTTQSKETAASIYVRSAIENFKVYHPFFSSVLSTESDVPESIVSADVKSFFVANPGGTYPLASAIRLTVNHVKSGLEVQTLKVVSVSRMILAGIFAVLFLANFAMVAMGAYSDIKVYSLKV